MELPSVFPLRRDGHSSVRTEICASCLSLHLLRLQLTPVPRRLRRRECIARRRLFFFKFLRRERATVLGNAERWLQDVPDTTRVRVPLPFELPSKGTPKFLRTPFEGNSRPTAPADGLPPERTRARHSTPSPCTRGTLPGRRLPAPPAGSSPERSSGSGRHSNMNNYMYKRPCFASTLPAAACSTRLQYRSVL